MRRLSYGTSVAAATARPALALATAATASTSRTNISRARSRPTARARSARMSRPPPSASSGETRARRSAVGISGTGGGFERFCRGETDPSNASRPIKQSESAKCRENGVRYVAFLVANDGLSIVVNKGVTWINCITPAEYQEDLGQGLHGQQLGRRAAGLPECPVEAVRAGHGLRHVRLLHREDQRQGEAEPLGLHGERGRQRARTRRRGRAERWATSASPTTWRTRAGSSR